ncbi:MAG: DUF1841 family protein [Undibacterium sp.]|nr:DUF1841 family protein [Undibacterium sp.]
MFNPTQQDVRRFFCETFRKYHANEILTPLETIAADWIVQHTEYAEDFRDVEAALAADYSVDNGKSNPFLHLSMHLTIAEQITINQPSGIRAAYEALAYKKNSIHEAHHAMMESLGEMIWDSQRTGMPPDGNAYLASLKKQLGK